MKLIADIDDVLNTTRAVRKRLDFGRKVEREVVEECLLMAQQAAVGSNKEDWRFVVVTELEVKSRIANLYRQVWEETVSNPLAVGESATVARLSPSMRETEEDKQRQIKILEGVKYLVDNLEEVPAILFACSSAPIPRKPMGGSASGYYGSIFPFIWSFQLALRSRGLGSVLATAIAHKAAEAARVLNLPEGCHVVAMIPFAYTQGKDFKRGARGPLTSIVRWEKW
jgi:nitroreductase